MFWSCYHHHHHHHHHWITKPIVANSSNHDPQNPPPKKISIPQKPSSLDSQNAKNLLPRRPPQPSVMQIQQAVGAGSFRDGEPNPRMKKDSDMKKTTEDLFLGQASEGELQKKLRETGEWLDENAETSFRSASEIKTHTHTFAVEFFQGNGARKVKVIDFVTPLGVVGGGIGNCRHC